MILVLCIAGMVSGAKAQDIFDSGQMTPSFGIRASLDISNFSGGSDAINNGFGFTLGGVYNIPLYKNLYFEPGVGIFYNTVGFDGYGEVADDMYANMKGSFRNWGFRMPLIFGYHFDFTDDMKVAVFTGPQFNYGLSMRMKADVWNSGFDVEGTEDVYNLFHRFDAQWVFGAAYHINQYMIGLSGAIGMTNLANVKHATLHRNVFSITFGYNF